MATRPAPPQQTEVPRGATPAIRPGADAAREALASLEFGEAPQVGLLGDTGAGKTVAMGELVKLYLASSPGTVFIIDDKGPRPRYEGQYRKDLSDLRLHPQDPNHAHPRTIVFRGDVMAGVDADPEAVAELAWKRAAHGRRTLVVHDELIAGREESIAKNRQWRKGVTYIPRSFTKGREVGVADFWGAQVPQMVPLEPFEQSHAILCFRLAGLGLETLRERDYLLGGAELVIPRLHAPPDPPHLRGDFVLLRRGQPWNGKIYKFEVKGSAA